MCHNATQLAARVFLKALLRVTPHLRWVQVFPRVFALACRHALVGLGYGMAGIQQPQLRQLLKSLCLSGSVAYFLISRRTTPTTTYSSPSTINPNLIAAQICATCG